MTGKLVWVVVDWVKVSVQVPPPVSSELAGPWMLKVSKSSLSRHTSRGRKIQFQSHNVVASKLTATAFVDGVADSVASGTES